MFFFFVCELPTGTCWCLQHHALLSYQYHQRDYTKNTLSAVHLQTVLPKKLGSSLAIDQCVNSIKSGLWVDLARLGERFYVWPCHGVNEPSPQLPHDVQGAEYQ
jgi:hypothetical protein